MIENNISKSLAEKFRDLAKSNGKERDSRLLSISYTYPEKVSFGEFEVGIESNESDDFVDINYVDFYSNNSQIRVYPKNDKFTENSIKELFRGCSNLEEEFEDFEMPEELEDSIEHISNIDKTAEDLQNLVENIKNQNLKTIESIAPSISSYNLLVAKSYNQFGDRGINEVELKEIIGNSSSINIAFSSHSMFLVYLQSGNSRIEQVGFIIGIDDTNQFFVHQIDSRRLEPDMEVGENSIRQALGISHDFDRDNITEILPLFEPSRVQGDLVMEKKVDYDSKEEVLRNYDYSEKLYSKICKKFGTEPSKELMNSTSIFISDNEVGVDIKKSYPNRANDMFDGVFPDINEEGEALTSSFISNLLSNYSIKQTETSEKDISNIISDITFTIDNHLVSIESGIISSLSPTISDPIQVFIPKESTISISHHEHPEKTFTLDKGLYEFSLLFEGFYPDGFEPPQW